MNPRNFRGLWFWSKMSMVNNRSKLSNVEWLYSMAHARSMCLTFAKWFSGIRACAKCCLWYIVPLLIRLTAVRTVHCIEWKMCYACSDQIRYSCATKHALAKPDRPMWFGFTFSYLHMYRTTFRCGTLASAKEVWTCRWQRTCWRTNPVLQLQRTMPSTITWTTCVHRINFLWFARAASTTNRFAQLCDFVHLVRHKRVVKASRTTTLELPFEKLILGTFEKLLLVHSCSSPLGNYGSG